MLISALKKNRILPGASCRFSPTLGGPKKAAGPGAPLILLGPAGPRVSLGSLRSPATRCGPCGVPLRPLALGTEEPIPRSPTPYCSGPSRERAAPIRRGGHPHPQG